MVSRRFLMGSMMAAAAWKSTADAAEGAPPDLVSRFAFEARVSVATPVIVGPSTHGLRRVVPITGGTFSGPRISGRVVSGGADWQYVRADGVGLDVVTGDAIVLFIRTPVRNST